MFDGSYQRQSDSHELSDRLKKYRNVYGRRGRKPQTKYLTEDRINNLCDKIVELKEKKEECIATICANKRLFQDIKQTFSEYNTLVHHSPGHENFGQKNAKLGPKSENCKHTIGNF